MPFDFDGRRLLWMTYLENDIRQLNIFDFDENKIDMVHQFSKKDGMISHAKFLKLTNSKGGFLFWIKNCT